MRFLVALVSLLVLAVTQAHHSPDHTLEYPEFVPSNTLIYDVTLNASSGVPGLHSQVSKSVIQFHLHVHAKSKTDLVLWASDVKSSYSLPNVSSDTARVELKKNPALEEKLKKPFTATYEHGQITKFTLEEQEDLESRKIKRTILRSLELHLEEPNQKETGRRGETPSWSPYTYNVSRPTPFGNFSSHYVVTTSPDPHFPLERSVYNISRSDNYEVLPYFAYQSHHNFEHQGCPEVCKKNHTENPFGAGCPSQQEPYHTPLRRAFYQKHNLRRFQNNGPTIIDTIESKETHTADLYDQNIQVVFKSLISYKKYNRNSPPKLGSQKEYTNINDYSVEINDDEVAKKCEYIDPRKAITVAKEALKQIASTVIEGKIEKPKAKEVGEQVILLQQALATLKSGDLNTIQSTIVRFDNMVSASKEDKVKRQIWYDTLPTIGTEESVSFIVKLIEENINNPNKDISLWESKSILEALPMNILEPTEKTITKLMTLLNVIQDDKTPGYAMFYSASHLAVARLVQVLCHPSNGGVPDTEATSPFHRIHSRRRVSEQKLFEKPVYRKECPQKTVEEFVKDIKGKLDATGDKTKRVIYIQTLARTGFAPVVEILKPYVNGHIPNAKVNQSYIDYVRTVTIHALYHLAPKHPKKVQDILVPVFLNKTEVPKIRTGAFGVIVKSHPTLGLLQHIAAETWKEPSIEVASYVTSTLESYGNSTIPCHQLTARRIKKILPQIKRHEGGAQHAKNKLWTLFDSIRGFGIEHKLEYTPSLESLYPSVVYGSLGANIDSFRDIVFQFAANIQGVSSSKAWEGTLKRLGLSHAQDIPEDKTSEIFDEETFSPKDLDFWRLVVFQKLFYTSSYYYYDAEGENSHEFYKILKDQYSHYMKIDKHGNMEGHIVRVYIPSSYHTKTLGYLPSPLEFEMRHPLVLSLKVKTDTSNSDSHKLAYNIDLTPSFYYTSLTTHHFLNLGDCKDIGSYHEKRMSATYPIRLTFSIGKKDQKFGFSYTVPDLPKTVFKYDSGSGTYAAKKKLVALPSEEERRVFKTIPSQFKREDTFGAVGIPPFESHVLSEDIQFGYHSIPRNSKELVNELVKRFLNAGWRRKSVTIKRVPSTTLWTHNTEVKVNFQLSRQHVIPTEKSNEDWTKDLKFKDELTTEDVGVYEKEGQDVVKRLGYLPHHKDKISLHVEQTTGHNRPIVTADIDFSYKHTYGGFLHLLHVNSSAQSKLWPKEFAMSASYAVVFAGRPDEFNYSPKTYGNQKGIVIGTISYPKRAPFTSASVATKGVFYYEPLQNVLKSSMHPTPSAEHFYPETHSECVDDVSKGKSQSVACIKAIQESSIYNRLRINTIWARSIPSFVKQVGSKIDLALKNALFPHMTVEQKSESKSLRLDATYINKMTDHPVIDFSISKPTEKVTFSRVKAGIIRPASSIETLYDTYVHGLTNNTYPATCALMKHHIRTYDLKTFKLPRENIASCEYILSAHCMNHKKFAVVVSIDPEVPGTKNIKIYLGKDIYTLTSSDKSSEYSIKHNEKEQVVKPHSPFMFDEEALIYATVHVTTDQNSPVDFYAKKAGIKITYNGDDLKIRVHPRYKGELCGLCSEFDGETTHEYRAPNRCLYSSPRDFFIANSVGQCDTRRNPNQKVICENEENEYRHNERRDGEESHPTLKRNVVLQRDDKFCFSTKPIPTCVNSSPVKVEAQNIDFHCLPKGDRNARKLVIESKRRILGEMETKKVHLTEMVDVPSHC